VPCLTFLIAIISRDDVTPSTLVGRASCAALKLLTKLPTKKTGKPPSKSRQRASQHQIVYECCAIVVLITDSNSPKGVAISLNRIA
jgi:hypothetical protein